MKKILVRLESRILGGNENALIYGSSTICEIAKVAAAAQIC